jgi:hypothetical protein
MNLRRVGRIVLAGMLLCSATMKVVFPTSARSTALITPWMSQAIALWEILAAATICWRPSARWPMWGCIVLALGGTWIIMMMPGVDCGCFGRLKLPRGVHLAIVMAMGGLSVWLAPSSGRMHSKPGDVLAQR